MNESNSDSEEVGRRYELTTAQGVLTSSRNFTGRGRAKYAIPETKTETFEGEYVKGVKEGHGYYRYGDGSSYEGSFRLNKKNGLGTASYKIPAETPADDEEGSLEEASDDAVVYKGHFYEGARNGNGSIKYVNGDTYTGKWLGGLKHGFGVYKFSADLSYYEGNWVHGFLSFGRWVLPTGAVYTGSFKRNKPHGNGKWIMINGTQIDVLYEHTTSEPVEGNEEMALEEDLSGSVDPEELKKVESVKATCLKNSAIRE